MGTRKIKINDFREMTEEFLRDQLRSIFKGSGMADHHDDISEAIKNIAATISKLMRDEFELNAAVNAIHADLTAIDVMLSYQRKPKKSEKGITILPYRYIVEFANAKADKIKQLLSTIEQSGLLV